MTRPARHIWRLLKWGRTLARHGALRGIERDPNTPPQVKRLARIARFGTLQPGAPDYAAAFQDIGPAAIKLGQSLATRPDLVGEEAAHNLLSLQDSLPPVPYAAIEAEIDRSFEAPVDSVFSYIDPEPVGSASIAQVHRAVTTEGVDVAVKVLRPGIRERLRQGHRHLRMGRRASRGARRRGPAAAPGADHRQFQALDQSRARLAARGGVGLRTGRKHARVRRLLHPLDRLGPDQWPGHDDRMDRRDQDLRRRGAQGRGPRSARAGAGGWCWPS